ncbi:MAG: MerR family transcriptional regulator [Candidatus Aminicenantales bacterium]
MEKDVFTQKELLTRFGLARDNLVEWTRLKLVRPEGYTDGQEPLFSEAAGQRIVHIQKLMALGYRHDEIQKIFKKVGVPVEKHNKQERKSKEKYLTVGSLAEQSNLSPRTIKHWEDKGIIEPDMRSEGGFRLYAKVYVYLCQLIKDLQLFGYTLEEIKDISGYFRDFLALQSDMGSFSGREAASKLETMLKAIKAFNDKMSLFKEGISRWDGLLKKKRKEIMILKQKNEKRMTSRNGGRHA